MTDRPVSLAAVIGVVDAFDGLSSIDRGVLMHRLRALPTFAPATPDAPKSVEEMAAEMGLTVADLALNMYRDTSGRYIRGSDIARLYAEHTTPTKPPREMPAPEWIGPDKYERYYGEPGDNEPVPAGYVAVGCWEPFAEIPNWGKVESGIIEMQSVCAWRRPLRRVSRG